MIYFPIDIEKEGDAHIKPGVAKIVGEIEFDVIEDFLFFSFGEGNFEHLNWKGGLRIVGQVECELVVRFEVDLDAFESIDEIGFTVFLKTITWWTKMITQIDPRTKSQSTSAYNFDALNRFVQLLQFSLNLLFQIGGSLALVAMVDDIEDCFRLDHTSNVEQTSGDWPNIVLIYIGTNISMIHFDDMNFLYAHRITGNVVFKTPLFKGRILLNLHFVCPAGCT